MKIALLGGAFDPPHVGHKTVADLLLINKIVDEVWFVPVFKHPWAARYQKTQLVAYEKRVAMLTEMIGSAYSQENKSSSSKEITETLNLNQANQKKQKVAHFKSVSFTYDTLEYFSKQHKEHSFSWVMGSEYLDRFDDFLQGHPQLLKYHFNIYPRAGHPFVETLKKQNMTFLYDMPEVTASSTEIKQLLQEQKPITQLVVPEVAQYIVKHKLYR